jgi:hypothetical protein
MIEISSGVLENLIVATAHGKVTAEDYEKILVPAVEQKLKTLKKVRLLYVLPKDFEGYTPEAMWDDAKLGLGHLKGFEKMAVVTDVHWIAGVTKFFGFFMSCPVKVFPTDQLEESKAWIVGAV